jgi:kynureninase
MSNPDWEAWRQEFPGLHKSTYLNTVSLGQLSRRSRAAINRFLDLWEAYGASAWYAHWLAEVDGLRAEFARLIGAGVDEVAIMPNISSALAAVSSSMDFKRRPGVISTELDFPTLTHHFLAKGREGVALSILTTPDRVGVPLEAFEAAISRQTTLVATCRVYFTSGYIQDVQAVASLAHRKGALCLIDDYQGTGQVPIDVKAAGVDFLVTGGLKWLIGGPGVAYLYVRRELIPGLQPGVAGWFGQMHQFDFDPHHLEFRPDARRFEAGTPSVAAVYAAKAGLEIINEIGSHYLRERTALLNQDLVGRLGEHGYRLRIPTNPEQHAGITILEIEEPLAITHSLAERGIIVDKRPGAVRVSPYFYNTLEENQAFIQALDEITKRK